MSDPNKPTDKAFPLSGSGSDVPQFSTAEYTHIPGTERCRICNNLISGEYFRVNSQMACSRCASEARDAQPRDSHAAFSRAVVFGIGASLVGMIAYATFTIITGWYIGYLALGVGYLVANAMKKGSSGQGGRRYQIAAVILTYAAISLAAVPIAISSFIKAPKVAHQQQSQASDSTGNESPQQPAPAQAPSSRGAVVVQLLLLGFASPFLELQSPVHGVIGLIILFVGLQISWRLTAGTSLDIQGPYPA